jgi:hypothetical protein
MVCPMSTSEFDISTVADTAADVLTEDGWTIGVYHDHTTGTHCLVGSIERAAAKLLGSSANWASDALHLTTPVCRAVSEHLGLPNASSIIEWNDDCAGSADAVIQVLRDTATKFRDDAMEVTSE